jgi:arachidonate 15-lipoxygenase
MTSRPDRRAFLRLTAALGAVCASRRTSPAEAAEPVCGRALLPQDDPDARARQRGLERARGRYRYDFYKVPTVPMLEHVPLPEQFAFPWVREVGDRAVDLARNFALASRAGKRTVRRAERQAVAALLARDVDALFDLAERAGAAGSGSDRPQSLLDYAALFASIERPAISETFLDDRVFARQRVAGPNPLVIRQVHALDDRFPVTDAIFRSVLPDDSLEAAGAEGRLFLADYRELDEVQEGLFRGTPKFLAAPLALFALTEGKRELVPVAIQCEQVPGPANPIFTPQHGHAWTMAKTIVQIADANAHEMISHLGRTHIWVEPFAIATERQLAANHPLRLLLRPHFEGTLAINEQAYSRLLGPGGFVDDLLGGTLEASIRLTAEAVRSYRVDEALLPAGLRARGVHDPAVLPDYPYRDDALLHWNAIRAWAYAYLSTYYRSDADVAADPELAAWYGELVAGDGGRITGWGKDGRLGGLDDLADAVTLIVFTSSVQHAAVNFPQFDLMTYIPNMPLAGFRPTPVPPAATEQDFLDLLPPLSSARRQIVILYVLGTIHYTRLGAYGAGEICDPRVQPAVQAFQQELLAAGRLIEERNLVRPPYPFLAPAGIPQSINI